MPFLVQRCCSRFFLLVVGAIAACCNCSTSAQTLAEALDATNLVWTTGGNANWFGQSTNTHDGVDAVRSGTVASNETSWIETTVVGPATFSYWQLASSNARTLTVALTVSGLVGLPVVQQVEMSGQWGQRTFDLGTGTNVLRWTVHDYYGGSGVGYYCMDEFVVLPPRPLAFTEQPGDQAVYPGEWTYLIADAVGTPPLYFQWQFNGTNINGSTNGWLMVDAVTTNGLGVYSVMVSNSQGVIVSSNATLSLLPPVAPTFYYQPESLTAYTGQQLTFSLGVSGSPPFSYQWRKEGTNILGASGSAGGGYGGGYGGGPGGDFSLTISNVSLADAGNYTVAISNSVGGIESTNATITVLTSVLPVITRNPRSLEVATGVNTWLSSAATGTPDPDFHWTRVGDMPPPPPSDPPFPPTELGSMSPGSNRVFYGASPTNAGVYFVTASNYAGAAVSSDALLTVLPPITNLGSWTEGANDIFVTNGRAYLAQDTNGLAILDVSNPAAPQLLGRYDTPGRALSVQVAGGLVFVADDAAGVQIISVTNPANPILVGNYNTPGSAQGVAVRSNLVFVADGNSGLLILNVTNPAAPTVVSSFVTNLGPACVCVSGNLAFLSSLNPVIIIGQTNTQVGGVLIVDISNPAQPFEVSRVATPTRSLAVRGSFVFTAEVMMNVLSTSNASQPVVVGSFTHYPITNSDFVIGAYNLLGIQARDVFVVNDLAYVIGNYTNLTSLYVLDVRDPSEPIPVGYFTLPGAGHTLWLDGQRVYIAGHNTPLTILETPFNPQPDSPPSLSLSKPGGMKLHIQGRRGLHYVVESAAGLTGLPWQPLQTLLLTNDDAVLDVPASSGPKFFRAKRLD